MTTMPPQTADIFKILSKGLFISSNSSNKSNVDLYELIDSGGNYELLRDYFLNIGFVLEKGDQYFYFSRQESKQDLEKKIIKAYKWIDYIDFLKTFDESFSVGLRFSISDILSKLKIDADLESKLSAINKDSKNWEETVKTIVDDLVKDSFIELCNEISGEYKVLAAFKYIEDLIKIININIQEDK
jgi:hypothetical protein